MREKNDLKENTVRGTIFGALERFSVMGIQIICTFIVARFLTPSDFGLVGLLIVSQLLGIRLWIQDLVKLWYEKKKFLIWSILLFFI